MTMVISSGRFPPLVLATMVGVTSYAPSGSTVFVTPPGGAQPGDVCIIFADYLASTLISVSSTSGGWTTYSTVASGWYNAGVATKKLTAADIAGNITVNNTQSGGVVLVGVYRNCDTATVVSYAAELAGSDTPDTMTIPGFVPNIFCKGIVLIICDRDPNVFIQPEAPFISQVTAPSSLFKGILAHTLFPTLYVPNSGIIINGLAGNGGGSFSYGNHGYAIQLL